MKKLNKLQINPERLIKNEELMTLRGGYGAGTCGWMGMVDNSRHIVDLAKIL